MRARVSYLNKILAGEQQQGGATRVIGSGGGRGSSGTAGPMGRMWDPALGDGLNKMLRENLVELKLVTKKNNCQHVQDKRH